MHILDESVKGLRFSLFLQALTIVSDHVAIVKSLSIDLITLIESYRYLYQDNGSMSIL